MKTVGNSADAIMKNFPGFLCNQGINVVFCNLRGVCIVNLRLEGEIATLFLKEKFLSLVKFTFNHDLCSVEHRHTVTLLSQPDESFLFHRNNYTLSCKKTPLES